MFESVNTIGCQHGLFDVLMITLVNVCSKLVVFVHKCQASHRAKTEFVTLLHKSRDISISLCMEESVTWKLGRMGMGWRKLPPPPIPPAFTIHPGPANNRKVNQ